jgi:four helix bundle protein
LLDRVESYCDRVLDLVAELERAGVSRRILDQLTGCSTAVGANLFEAHEALSRKDFIKCLAIGSKELSECRFWVRLVGRRGWVGGPDRFASLLDETEQLSRIFGTIITRSKSRTPGS